MSWYILRKWVAPSLGKTRSQIFQLRLMSSRTPFKAYALLHVGRFFDGKVWWKLLCSLKISELGWFIILKHRRQWWRILIAIGFKAMSSDAAGCSRVSAVKHGEGGVKRKENGGGWGFPRLRMLGFNFFCNLYLFDGRRPRWLVFWKWICLPSKDGLV